MAAADLEQLKAVAGPHGILLGDDVSARSCDPFVHVPNEARAILTPASTAELSDMMRWCYEHDQTMVVQGGLTGVSGAARTSTSDVAISLERMDRIESIDPVTRTAVVQAGVTLQRLEEAAEDRDLFYPLDLGARGSATLGGTIATNAGGNRVVRWGMTRALVLGLEVVLADGRVLSSMNTLLKNNTGYDLKQLFIGSEGTLGVIARAVVRLVPRPRSTNVAVAAANRYEQVLELLNAASSLSTLSAFEVMWRNYLDLLYGASPAVLPLPNDYAYCVLIETKGSSQSRDGALLEEFLAEALERGTIDNAVVAQSERQCANLWQLREAGMTIAGELDPMLSFDISLPIDVMDDYLHSVEQRLSSTFRNPKMVFFGHLGDSNIHIGLSVGDVTNRNAAAIEEIVYRPLAALGGSVSAEHGIGSSKKQYLSLCRSEQEILTMKAIKQTLDPRGLLNAEVLFTH